MELFSRKKNKNKYFFLAPAILWIIAFSLFPLIYSLTSSFYNFRLTGLKEFVGLSNYVRALKDERVLNSVKVSLFLIVTSVSIEMILGMFIALLVNQLQFLKGIKIFRTIFTIPLFATPVAVSFLGMTLFYEEGGPINTLFSLLHLGKVAWLSSPNGAVASVLLLEIWQWTPFCFLIILSGLQSLPLEVYEASALETNSEWKIFWNITFPMLRPIFIVLLFLKTIESLKILEIPYVLTEGGPGRATEVFSMLIYRQGFKAFDIGYASALSYLLLIVVALLFTFVFGKISESYE